ncbi:MAG: hypothetical protein LBL52_02185 [Rickettsiales bacterium]|jgi:MraZ protein|nr:hypothetical protein [Rickettsiales bacterium]
MLFLGSIANKIDAKGRVSVPAEFRSGLHSGEFQGVILYHSFTGRCIEGCTLERMEKISDAADTMDMFGEEAQSLNSLIFSDARRLAFDIAGRIVVPMDLLEFSGIKGDALFVGRGKTFQIWNPDDFKVAQSTARHRALESRPSLIIPKG